THTDRRWRIRVEPPLRQRCWLSQAALLGILAMRRRRAEQSRRCLRALPPPTTASMRPDRSVRIHYFESDAPYSALAGVFRSAHNGKTGSLLNSGDGNDSRGASVPQRERRPRLLEEPRSPAGVRLRPRARPP